MHGLDFSRGPFIMGIVNCTPDSFFPASRADTLEKGVNTAFRMIREGADILDIGGESSRPGSEYISEEEELKRILPVIEKIRNESDIPISVDTRKSEVARQALDAGADMINDISALKDDPLLGRLAAERNIPVILMHMRGNPKTMQKDPHFDDTVVEVKAELLEAAENALRLGIVKGNIILDPGIGFGKRVEDNLRLLEGIPRLKSLGYPLLIGLSRKAFIGRVVGSGKDVPAEHRLIGTVAANTLALLKGADILRVHDVGETRELAAIVRAVEGV